MRPFATSIKTGASYRLVLREAPHGKRPPRFAPVCLIEVNVVLHHPFKEAHAGAHKAVFKLKTCMLIHTNA